MISKTFPIVDRMNLRCRFSTGSLTVHAQDGLTEAAVTVTARSGNDKLLDQFQVELAGRTIEVREPRDRGGNLLENLFGRGTDRSVDVVVALPTGADVDVQVHSADIRIDGRVGSSDIASASSTIEVDEVGGNLRARIASGDVTINRVLGSGTIRGASSRVRIGEAGSALSVGLGTGDLAIGAAHGSVRMRSGSGGAVIGVAEDDVDVTSGSGTVTVGLREGQQARLDVLTASGRLHTDMPVENRAPGRSNRRPITVRARTGAGDVRIHRAG